MPVEGTVRSNGVSSPIAFLTDLATNASAHNMKMVFYSGNDDSLVNHWGTEGTCDIPSSNYAAVLTLGLPLTLEDVLRRERRRPRARRRDDGRWTVGEEKEDETERVQRRRVLRLIEGVVSGLERVERAL